MRQGPATESPPGAISVRFGPFSLDPQTGELYRDGLRLKLSGQAIEVLRILITRPGQLVTREELQQQLWPDAEYGDFEHGLNAAVNRLRETLRDSASEPKYIETVPRRGYRFTRQIESEAAAPAMLPLPRRRRPLWLYAAVSAGAGIAILGVIFSGWIAARFRPRPPLRVLRFSTSAGWNGSPSFSPDGNYIAYIHRDEAPGSQFNIYVQMVGAPAKVQLTHDDGAADDPAWSPDGRYIAYWRFGGGARQLMLIPAIGGTPRKLYTARIANDVGPLSWSPDAERLAFTDGVAPAGTATGAVMAAIHLLSLKDMTVRQLTYPGRIDGDRGPAFSHDGRWLAFHRAINLMAGDLHLLDLKTGELRRLTFDSAACTAVAWSADDKWIMYASTKGTGFYYLSALWRVSPRGGVPELVPGGDFDAFQVAIAPTGNRLAYQRVDIGRSRIWRVEVGARTAATPLFPDSDALDVGPSFSKDGKRIAFSSARSGHLAIWTADADGSKPMLLVNVDNGGTPRWSPDGRWIAYDNRPAGLSDIFVIDAQGGKPRRLSDGQGDNMVPSWSADSRWVYFASNRTGEWQIWKSSIDGAAPVQVTRNGGLHAFESADGKFLYFDKPRETPYWVRIAAGIWKVPVGGGAEALLIGPRDAPRSCFWVPARTGIYWLDIDAKPVPEIKKYDFRLGRTTVVGHAQDYLTMLTIGLSSDERSLLYSAGKIAYGTEIMLVENFR